MESTDAPASSDSAVSFVGNNANELVVIAGSGDIQELERLLATGLSVNATNHKGETALMEAAYKGHPEVCEYLINKGADPLILDMHFKNTVRLLFLVVFPFLSSLLVRSLVHSRTYIHTCYPN